MRNNALPDGQWNLYAKVAANARDWALAKQVAERWLVVQPGHTNARRALVLAEAGLKNDAAAVRLGQVYLDEVKKDDADVRAAVTEARARLAALLGSDRPGPK